MPVRLIGMVHLGPLPGASRFAGRFEEVLERAVADTLALAEAGFDAVMLENYGDAPFYADDVPKVTVAAMARAAATVRAAVDLPLGVNVLRNDAEAALSVAASCDAQFIRVNVLAGTMFTDQGMIQGRTAELARLRVGLAQHIEVLADVYVKHAVAPAGWKIEQAAADTYERGGADALIVSGPSTGKAPDKRSVERIRKVLPDAPVILGSGVTRRSVSSWAGRVQGIIVGTDIKEKGLPEAPVDGRRAASFVRTTREAEEAT